jgi:membrane fusion protein, multidrug efflux system
MADFHWLTRGSLKMTGSSTQTKAGRLLSLGIVLYTVVISSVALHKANANPRTDDAEVFANFIGIAPQVDGPIAKLYVRDNQFVRKGDLLLEIDDRPYAYALELARSDRDSLEGEISEKSRTIAAEISGVGVAQADSRNAAANLQKAAASIDEAKAEVANAQAGLARAQADLAYATNNLHRIEPLLAEKFVTVDQVDQAHTLEESRQHAVEQARSQLKMAEATLQSTQAEYDQGEATVEQSLQQIQQSRHSVTTLESLTTKRSGRTSAIETAQYNLNNCRIYAPFDGRVTNLTVSEGAYAHTGQQIFTLIDTRTWWVIGNFRETQLKHIRSGMEAEIYALSDADRPLHGIVESVGFGVTPDADTIGKLAPGLPDVQRTLNWVHLASRFPVRVRIVAPPAEAVRLGESAVVIIRNSKAGNIQ